MKKIISLALMPLILSACGGSGGGGSSSGDPVSGIELPDSMSVVTAQDSGGQQKLTFGKTLSKSFANQNKILTDADTDYSTDLTHSYVYDASMESLDSVNMILCLMEQTRATDMVNQGAYIALVNEDKCEKGQNQSSSGSTGQSSGGQATEFNSWTILSTRDSNNASQVVKIWVPGDSGPGGDPMDSQTILVELTATEGVSSTNPFGSFSMDFKGVVDASVFEGPAGTEMEMMRGHLETVDNSQGQPQFRFINLGGDSLSDITGANFSFEEAANVVLNDAAGTGGVALTHRSESFSGGDGGPTISQGSAYAVAFDSNYLLRGKDDNADGSINATSCQSRTSFNTQVWRYNLYHAVDGTFNGKAVTGGQRVELNSGFPFSYDSNNDGSNNAYGWVGYHGVWSELGALADGATITEFDYETDSTIEHTVNVAPGKMIRRTANNELLSGFQGDEFQFWGDHPTLNIFGQWVVSIDGNNDLQITGSFNWGDTGPEISATVDHDNDPGTAEVSAVASLSLNNNEHVWLWSDALGGNVAYVHDNSIAAADRSVTFYGEEFVLPADSILFPGSTSSVTLFCYERCLKGGLTQSDVDNASSEMDLYYSYAGTPFQYTLSTTNGKIVLTDNSNSSAVVSADTLDISSLGNDWGINTGEMLTSQLANAAEPWLVFDETVSYRWETGNNDWNKMITVSDSMGNISTFDRPLQFSYTHSTANDANTSSSYNGKKFFLEYGGVGELWGFPWEEDIETNRWYSAVTLADGAQLTNGSNTFAVKAIEKEQTMRDDNAGCNGLNVSTLLTDPALTLPTAADIGTVSINLAGKPNVTAAPAVIDGELQ